MPDREYILHRVRAALGRRGGQAPEAVPPARLVVPASPREERLRRLLANFPGETFRASSPAEALQWVAAKTAGCAVVASSDTLLEDVGILSLGHVRIVHGDQDKWREQCARADVGISGADYVLTDPPALVLVASAKQPRIVSLLPPRHLTVIREDQILSGLDELFTLLPDPAQHSSSLVLVGGPSRTGDIEMILTLGVHGPREISLLVLGHDAPSPSADARSARWQQQQRQGP